MELTLIIQCIVGVIVVSTFIYNIIRNNKKADIDIVSEIDTIKKDIAVIQERLANHICNESNILNSINIKIDKLL